MTKLRGGMAKRFTAVLEKEMALGWTIARVPFDPAKAFAKMIRQRVCGEVAGIPFRSSLFADVKGSYLLVNRETLKQAGLGVGDEVDILLQADLEPRPAELPEALEFLLAEEPGLRGFYDELSESMRREIGKWVLGVKNTASQMRRAQQMAERLLATMEAEKELPPLIARGFHRRPKARLGWERMTPLQRRTGLMAVFYYQTPEARERRLEKLLDDAERRAEAASERAV